MLKLQSAGSEVYFSRLFPKQQNNSKLLCTLCRSDFSSDTLEMVVLINVHKLSELSLDTLLLGLQQVAESIGVPSERLK